MTERNEAKAATSSPVPAPLCPICAAPARFVTSMLDLRHDRPILIYRCDSCRDEGWVDEVAPITRRAGDALSQIKLRD